MTALPLALLVLLPVTAGAALLLTGRRADRAAAPVAVGVAAGTLVLAVLAAALRPAVAYRAVQGVTASLAVDGLSGVAVVVVAAVLLAVLVFAAGDIGADEARARFHGLMLLFAAAMLVTVTATNVLTLLAAWEVMGATSYALIGYWWREPRRVASGTVAFLTTRTADLGMYAAAGAVLAGGAPSLGLGAIGHLPSGWRDLAVAGLVLAALGKSAQLPFSFWLSRAMDGPSPVSALLHSATMVAAGGYLLLRLQPALASTGWAAGTVAWAGAATALVLGAVAVLQPDLKQMLAASTCSQIGFLVLGAGSGTVAGGTAQFAAHAATKSLLFLVAGAWLTVLGTKDLNALRGAARTNRVIGVCGTIGLLALGGAPPLSIWLAKDAILAATLPGSPALYVTGLAAAVVSAAYAGRVLAVLWARPEREEVRPRFAAALLAPLPALAAAAVLLGAVVLPPLAAAWARLLGARASEPPLWQPLLSGLLAIAVLAGVAALQAGRLSAGRGLLAGPAVLRDWLRLEPLASVLAVRPALALAEACARFDDRVLAGAVDGVGRAGPALSRVVERRLERPLDGTVLGAAAGVRRLGRLARRPQTGLLHQYYAQATVAVVALALVLLVVR